MNIFPRRPTPVISPPSTAESGGSNVFSALIPGAIADSIRDARDGRADAARGDLDLGELGHTS